MMGTTNIKIEIFAPDRRASLIQGNRIQNVQPAVGERSQEVLPPLTGRLFSSSIQTLLQPHLLLDISRYRLLHSHPRYVILEGTGQGAIRKFFVKLNAQDFTIEGVSAYNAEGNLVFHAFYRYEAIGDVHVPQRVDMMQSGRLGNHMVELRLENIRVNSHVTRDDLIISF